MNNSIDSELLDVKDLAKMLKISIQTVYTWVSQKRIPYIKLGRRTVFSNKAIKDWLDSQSIEPHFNN